MHNNYAISIAKIFIGITIIGTISSGCKKFVAVEAPETNISEANVYKDDITATAVLTSIYTAMSGNISGLKGLASCTGLSSDELTLFSGVGDQALNAYYKNALISNKNFPSGLGSDLWAPFYRYIYYCNAALEGLNASTSLSPAVKQQLIGEAKFMRAFCYFYLVNLFGEVPLAITTDFTQTAVLARSPIPKVYSQIEADLKDAQNLLSSVYLDGSLKVYAGSAERLRPTKWAATALLARVYLFEGNHFADAELEASKLINHTSLFSVSAVPLNGVFLKNSKESIWQLQPTATGRNTEDGWVFVLPGTGPNSSNKPVHLSPHLLNRFDPADQRLTVWVKSITVSGTTFYYPFKYTSATLNSPVTEYLMMFRLGEQYLIRAEAKAQQGNVSGAADDLNVIRNRAGLSNTNATTVSDLLIAIQKERQLELFTESGHRWLDLKRTGKVDEVMTVITPLKSGEQWQSYQQLYPIPHGDIEKGPNLVQNPGYQ